MLLLLRGSAERRGARERIGAIEKLHSCIDGRTTSARYRKDHQPPSRRSPCSAQQMAARRPDERRGVEARPTAERSAGDP
jgi:hypothetical protein